MLKISEDSYVSFGGPCTWMNLYLHKFGSPEVEILVLSKNLKIIFPFIVVKNNVNICPHSTAGSNKILSVLVYSMLCIYSAPKGIISSS